VVCEGWGRRMVWGVNEEDNLRCGCEGGSRMWREEGEGGEHGVKGEVKDSKVRVLKVGTNAPLVTAFMW